MSKEFKHGMKWSLTVHALLFVLLAMNGFHMPGGQSGGEAGEQANSGHKSDQIDVEIIDPPSKEAEVSIVEQSAEDALLQAAPHAKDDCDSFYGGIGIIQNYHSNGFYSVNEVYPGYPAHRAGILPGDVLMNTDDIRGDIGTPIKVRISRNGTYMEFDLIRDKICTTPPKNKGANP